MWVEAFRTGNVEAASDGSVKSGISTYAVVFTSGRKHLRFQGLIDCHPALIQSYRAELTSLLVIYYFMWCLSTFAQCSCPEIPAHVDNSAAVTANNVEELAPGFAEHTCSDFDILNKIQQIKQKGLNVKAQWVEVHQDTKYPQQVLSDPAKLNCMVDADVSKNMATEHTLESTPPDFSSNKATLILQGVVATSNIQALL
eukprot:809987-Ditylum_brightwellii.AAC.1